MLGNSPAMTCMPSTDLARTRDFYVNKLGLTVDKETESGITFRAGENTFIYLYKRGPSKADHTEVSFKVDNTEIMIDELVKKGIVFEQYDFPGLKTDAKGMVTAETEGIRAAWFKDPDGNIISINEEV